MTLDLTTLEASLKRDEELAAKATEGEWFVASDPARDCPAHRNSGLALIDTGRMEDFTVARLMEWNNANFIAHARTALLARVKDCRTLARECEIDRALAETRQKALAEAVERYTAAESSLAEAVRALERAAKWFREYEAGHRAKGQDLLSLEKANRNAARADFCEREVAALSSLQPRKDTP